MSLRKTNRASKVFMGCARQQAACHPLCRLKRRTSFLAQARICHAIRGGRVQQQSHADIRLLPAPSPPARAAAGAAAGAAAVQAPKVSCSLLAVGLLVQAAFTEACRKTFSLRLHRRLSWPTVLSVMQNVECRLAWMRPRLAVAIVVISGV